MHDLTQHDDPRRSKRRRLKQILLLVLMAYGIYGLWRVVPRFDSRLLGTWNKTPLIGAPVTYMFFDRGSGRKEGPTESRSFRWWTCGNKFLIHDDRGSRRDNIRVTLEYAVRTMLFLGPPEGVTEFTVANLDSRSVQLLKRPEISDGGNIPTLQLRR